MLSDLFIEQNKRLIMQIPWSKHEREDSWMWSREAKGVYTVKSGYRRFTPLPDNPILNFSWISIWKMKVPPKVK